MSGHLWYKPRQNATWPLRPTRSLYGPSPDPKTLGSEALRLLDGHRKPPDQLRHFFQTSPILRFDGMRQPRQAFVVTERGNVDSRYRGGGPDAFGLDDIRHQITSIGPGARKLRGNCVHLASKSGRCAHGCVSSDLLRKSSFASGRTRRKPLSDHGFQPMHERPQKPAIWSYASRKGFVIRCPLANMCFAHSSVAQR